MIRRAIILGFIGAIFISAFTYFNDAVIRQNLFIGNHMPVSVYGGLILFILIINPLLFYTLKRFVLSSRELAIILTLVLAVCCIPASGLMRYFIPGISLPHHYNRTEPGWKENNVIKMAPEKMLIDTSKNESTVVDGFLQGMSEANTHIPVTKVPWYAWKRTLAFWLPLVLSLWIALIGLSLVIHKQWSEHEHLPYPIAEFTKSLLPENNQIISRIFKSRLFWIGAGIAFFYHFNNYMYGWFPRYLEQLPTQFDFWPLYSLSEVYRLTWMQWALYAKIFFSVIAIAYFIPKDISFSFGIGPPLFVLIYGIFLGYGIPVLSSIEGGGPSIHTFFSIGASLGIFFGILYMGRYYYLSVFKKALFLPAAEQIDRNAVWGFRIFIVFTIIFISQLILTGLDWYLSIIYAVFTIMVFLIMSRVFAESGLFFIQIGFFPSAVIWGIFGLKALGPKTMLIMALLSMVFLRDPREALMPYIVNSFKLLDLHKIKIGKIALFCSVALIVGIFIAVPINLYINYDRGYKQADDGWAYSISRAPFQDAVLARQRLKAQGILEQAESISGWQRFKEMSPNVKGIVSLGIGLVLVLLFTAARLHFPKWPLHPIMFLTWWGYAGYNFYFSFFLGWLIKIVVTRYGGSKLFQKFKPFMVGLIAGEITMALVPVLVGAVYYFATGEPPKRFYILPP